MDTATAQFPPDYVENLPKRPEWSNVRIDDEEDDIIEITQPSIAADELSELGSTIDQEGVQPSELVAQPDGNSVCGFDWSKEYIAWDRWKM